MSFLAPLFLVGALAVALPVVFHLIRRTTRERVPFSSLMFLTATPPRVTRRSRLENIFLLLLRCLVIGLLAVGFARPFLRHAETAAAESGPGRRVLVLVDTSASMRRDGLWAGAQAQAAEVLKKLSPMDQAAVFAFDRTLNRRVSFEDWETLPLAERAATALKRLESAGPGWAATHLDAALTGAAEALEGRESAARQIPRKKQLVVISDFQEGSRLNTLQGFEWPKEIEIVPAPVKSRRTLNAGLQLVPEGEESGKSDAGTRVRVMNAADSKREQFQIGWVRGAEKSFAGAAVDVYVPPGQSRVVNAPTPPTGAVAERVWLKGDDEEFDNVVFALATPPTRANVLYLGRDDGKDTAQPLYFLRRAFQETRRQVVQVIARTPDAVLTAADLERVSLIVVGDAPSTERLGFLRQALAGGKIVLFTLKSREAAAPLGPLLGVEDLRADEAAVANYAMWAEIDFQHPLFAPFADPRFSDFTKIHFWKHRRLPVEKIPGARVLARFDNGDAALVEAAAGKGRVFILTAGWHPADSQLAVSSKFVPLLYSLLEQGGGGRNGPLQFIVGDEVPLPPDAQASAVTVRKPDGKEMSLAAGATKFSQTDQPGIYTITMAGGAAQRFAVNLDPAESRTAPLSLDELERLGVPLKKLDPSAVQLARSQRELQNAELEGRQKMWRWLVVAALLALAVETLLAAWLTRRSTVESTPA
ncbi:MAG: BatA domain-containing protein [Verrucomicrobia bacterium]|nr:BatA domain-containing protein [Verrucomicrobiota bacterium]